MKYSEATKLIEGLSEEYSIDNNSKSIFELIYKNKYIAWVDKQKRFNLVVVDTLSSKFAKMPYSHKIWMILTELARTSLDKRKEEHKWNVVVGEDNSKGSPLVIWVKADHSCHDYFLGGAEKNDLKDSETRFSDSEYAKLIEYIKTLPDGEWQARVAEHGKTEVKSEDLRCMREKLRRENDGNY